MSAEKTTSPRKKRANVTSMAEMAEVLVSILENTVETVKQNSEISRKMIPLCRWA